MYTPLSRLFALFALVALLPIGLACDDADVIDRPPGDDGNVDGDDDTPPAPIEVDAEALAAAFGCDVTVVALGTQAEGMFEDAACRLDDGRAVVYYAFGVDEEDEVTAEAGSAWFDTVLYLYDDQGDVLVENDDVDPFDTNSRLEAELERGVYVAGLTAFDSTSSGFYRFMAAR
ncbi:MAG TPA: hypothetical protein VD838_10025 [Anaeromyxobacteraceae bacterium]|nr:hypothetical protein [Anaeromyxobacteraceae bacterium]